MKEIFQNNRFRFLAFVLLLGNAFLLPITADEAYYFSWSRDLSLGYYDHPPLVAWMMSAVSSEYLRTPFLLLVLAFVFLGKERSIGKFIFIPGVHLFLGGALPDTLMIIAGFMVLHSFRRWANSRNIVNAIILGVCIAALGYSKFHGILLIFSLAVGYWHLRKEWTLYLAIAIAFILLMPYLWWQMEMDWVTFRYHFSGRFGSSSFPSLLEYLAFGALLWWPLILFFRPLPIWGKALIISAILLFGWGAYNGSAEVHWLLIFMWIIPALELPDSKRTRNVAYLITILHALVWVSAVRDRLSLNEHFRDDVREIYSKENVVFLDAYQDAAIYELATGKESYSLSHPGIRKSQYNLQPFPYDGEEVVVYNRIGMGELYFEGPFYSVRETLYDLSGLHYEWKGWSLRIDASEIPQGYYWILYTYVDGKEQRRDRLCPGDEIPNVAFTAGTDQFLTLEKNWLPSGLWIPLP